MDFLAEQARSDKTKRDGQASNECLRTLGVKMSISNGCN